MLPKAEHLTRRDLQAIEFTHCKPEIVDLSRDEESFCGLGFGPKRSSGFSNDLS
jgi:hypothetical protein